MHHLKLFLLLLPVFALIDLTWLGVIMKGFYDAEYGDLARRSNGAIAPRLGEAFLVYMLIPLGIILFVRPQLGASPQILDSLLWGALYGFVVYGVNDLTNRTIIDKYSLRLTLADWAWGTVLCATSAAWMTTAEKWFLKS